MQGVHGDSLIGVIARGRSESSRMWVPKEGRQNRASWDEYQLMLSLDSVCGKINVVVQYWFILFGTEGVIEHSQALEHSRPFTGRDMRQMAGLHVLPMETLKTYEMDFGTKAQCFFDQILPPDYSPFIFLPGQNAGDNIRPKLKCLWSLTRLTFLSIDYMAMDESPSMDMLKLVLTLNRETLETFEIQGATDAHFDIGEELPTELLMLTHLTVGYKSQWDAIVFLCKFRAPALKHLKLRHITRSIAAEHWRRLSRHGYNAVSAATLNVLQLPRDPSSTFLLEDLLDIHTSMLQQVETLELVDIYAVPLFGEDFERGNDPLKHSYRSRVIFAYRILAACSKLRCLILGEPDPCFLDALNVYPDDRDKRRPVPALTHLHVTCDYCGHLKFFWKKRAEIFDDSKVDGPRRLD
ncbi:hypothetical protein DFH29DRAFT_1043460 [Suillus ampliporus]|nr:hypothetical protein DFH29DRAFT_1043460 [Suillus ampliporus]